MAFRHLKRMWSCQWSEEAATASQTVAHARLYPHLPGGLQISLASHCPNTCSDKMSIQIMGHTIEGASIPIPPSQQWLGLGRFKCQCLIGEWKCLTLKKKIIFTLSPKFTSLCVILAGHPNHGLSHLYIPLLCKPQVSFLQRVCETVR